MAIYGGGGRMGAYATPAQNAGSAFGGVLGAIGGKLKDWAFDDKGLVRANPDGPGMPILGKKKGIDSWQDQKGLVQQRDDGNYRLGTQTGVDNPDEGLFQENEDGGLRLGSYEGLDALKGENFKLGKEEGIDESTKEAYQGLKSKFYDDKGLFRASPEGPNRFIMGKKKGVDILDGKGFLGKKPGLDKPFLGKKPGFDSPYLANVGSRLRTMLAGNKEGGAFNTEMRGEGVNKTYDPEEAYGMLKKGMNVNEFNKEQLGVIQQLMKDEGFYGGKIDATLGPKTANAFNEMMKHEGLLADPIEEYQGDGPVYPTPPSQVSGYGKIG